MTSWMRGERCRSVDCAGDDRPYHADLAQRVEGSAALRASAILRALRVKSRRDDVCVRVYGFGHHHIITRAMMRSHRQLQSLWASLVILLATVPGCASVP